MPDDAVKAWIRDSRSAVVTLTHDPKLDDLALMEALVSPAFYIGALGSKTTNENRRQRLLELGITATNLQRLHAPVGFPIGSRSPPEIAIAILAEMTAVRNRVYHGNFISRWSESSSRYASKCYSSTAITTNHRYNFSGSTTSSDAPDYAVSPRKPYDYQLSTS